MRSKHAVALALGYSGHLPRPFRAIIAVLVNLVLAALAIWFLRGLERPTTWPGTAITWACRCRWRLASGARSSRRRPASALSAYAILYLLGVWVFAAPQVTYLGVAALAGAFYFGSTLVPGTTISGQALLAAAIGCACWSTKWLLCRLRR